MKYIYLFYKCYNSDTGDSSQDVNGIYTSFEEAKAAANAYLSYFGIQGPYSWEKNGDSNWSWKESYEWYYLINRRKLNERWWEDAQK